MRGMFYASHQLQDMHDAAIMKRTKLRLEADAALGEQEKRAMELRGKQERAEQERLLAEQANQHRLALEFARAHGRPSYQYLLQPRVKGLAAVLEGARPRLTHALDLTIAYEGFAAECERNARPAGLLDGIVRSQVCAT